MPEIETQFRHIAEAARHAADYLDDCKASLASVLDTASEIGRAWSGSNLGYHAQVYFTGLRPPPPGSHFDMDWGLMQTVFVQATTGAWREFDRDEILEAIWSVRPDLDRSAVAERADSARAKLDELKSRFRSIVSIASPQQLASIFRDLGVAAVGAGDVGCRVSARC